MNISSAIIYTQGDFQDVIDALGHIEGCEVHLSDAQRGIIIVSIEAEEIIGEMQILEQINALDGVLEAHMHYSYSADELQKAKEQISGDISALNEETPIEEIRYSGSVYHQMHKTQR